jgi:hypothetical protein
MAHLLGISETRLQQLTGLGIVKRSGGHYEPLQTALDYLAYVKRDDEAKTARTRQVNAKALQIEQRVRRDQRRMVSIDELSGFTVLMFECALDSYQTQSSIFYHEFRQTHDEQESLKTTHRLYEPLRLIAQGWSNGMFALIDQINRDQLPNDARLDRVLAKLIAEITASNAADAKKLAKPKPKSSS